MRNTTLSAGDGLRDTHWRKSSYSGGNDDCVEVALVDDAIAVRDSKNPTLNTARLSATAWSEFVQAVSADGTALNTVWAAEATRARELSV